MTPLSQKILGKLVWLGIFLAGFALGVAFWDRNHEHTQSEEIRAKGDLTSPLLECESDSVKIRFLYGDFWEKLRPVIRQEQQSPGIQKVSVYFRDLLSGPSFGENLAEEFSPASLLKVPLMMAYLRWSIEEPGLFERKITFKRDFTSLHQNVPPDQRIQAGKTYTVDQLVSQMIEYSDNDAANVLYENIDRNRLAKAYTDIGVEVPGPGRGEDFMTVREYASFFRMLFNSSYLPQEKSESALRYLIRSRFKDGLVAGVPQNIRVAHKFGERILQTPTGPQLQLHDCGIIYHPQRPFLMCIMTRGQLFKQQAGVIQRITKAAYQGLESRIAEAPK